MEYFLVSFAHKSTTCGLIMLLLVEYFFDAIIRNINVTATAGQALNSQF